MRKFFKKSQLSVISYQLSKSTGFTLIELVVVIAIIGIMTGLISVNFIGIRGRGRDTQRKSDLRQIQAALELYRSDNGAYPAVLYTQTCPTSSPLQFGSPATVYLQKIPCNPNPVENYTYTTSSPYYTYAIWTCLENRNDKDSNNVTVASGVCTSLKKFELKNP